MASSRVVFAALVAVCSVAASLQAPSLRSHINAVYDPLVVSPVDALNASSFTADRDFTFPKSFALDAPFTISLRAGESVFIPFAPIHKKLFPDGSADPKSFALGFELNVCEGRVLSSIDYTDGRQEVFSSSHHQCATITKANDQQWFNLCPVVNSVTGIALREDPTKIKGILLRADIKKAADVVALLRSTAYSGAYKKSFFVPDPDAPLPKLNVTYSTDSTQLSFDSVMTWEPTEATPKTGACDGCEYTVYAEMVPPVNGSVIPRERPPPPYCLTRSAAVTYTLPASTNEVSIHKVTVADSFADRFSISGEYQFVLVASVPSKSNNGHVAMIAYAPTRVPVTAPSHFISRLLVAIGVLAVIAFLIVVAIKSEIPALLWQARTAPEPPAHDDESVRLLAQAIADQEADEVADAEPHDDDLGATPPTLLDAIRKTQAKLSTPQQSPRTAPIQLDGYQEIN